jgi:hypothetical protein
MLMAEHHRGLDIAGGRGRAKGVLVVHEGSHDGCMSDRRLVVAAGAASGESEAGSIATGSAAITSGGPRAAAPGAVGRARGRARTNAVRRRVLRWRRREREGMAAPVTRQATRGAARGHARAQGTLGLLLGRAVARGRCRREAPGMKGRPEMRPADLANGPARHSTARHPACNHSGEFLSVRLVMFRAGLGEAQQAKEAFTNARSASAHGFSTLEGADSVLSVIWSFLLFFAYELRISFPPTVSANGHPKKPPLIRAMNIMPILCLYYASLIMILAYAPQRMEPGVFDRYIE